MPGVLGAYVGTGVQYCNLLNCAMVPLIRNYVHRLTGSRTPVFTLMMMLV